MLRPTNKKSIFVIIPAYNEHQAIGTVIEKLLGCGYRPVVIDDGSDTSLYHLLKNMPVFFLRHAVNLGQGAAIQTGIEFALSQDADYIVTFDADGQHGANDIEKLVQALADRKLDIVLGSRFQNSSSANIPLSRKLLLHAGRYMNYLFTGLLLTDAHNGLRAMTRQTAEKIQIRENRMSHATEFLSQIKKHKLCYAELPVTVRYTAYSLQKGQGFRDSFRILFDILLNKFFR